MLRQLMDRVAEAIAAMTLKYVVITSVDRDGLRDGGAGHFADCIAAVRALTPTTTVEILVPDFRGRMQVAIDRLSDQPPDVFNHNLETVPRLYRRARPGADYQWSLDLLRRFGEQHQNVPTKSGIMLGLGETLDDAAGEAFDKTAEYRRDDFDYSEMVNALALGAWACEQAGKLSDASRRYLRAGRSAAQQGESRERQDQNGTEQMHQSRIQSRKRNIEILIGKKKGVNVRCV